jgi:hypothetical protein
LTTPGITKPICQWYAKGNCKFGHKVLSSFRRSNDRTRNLSLGDLIQCALAHILPGQPLSWDRKNKRAAQAALRESTASNDIDATAPDNGPTAPIVNSVETAVPSSGIGRSLGLLDRESGGGHDELGVEGWNVVTMPVQEERQSILASTSNLGRPSAPSSHNNSASPQFASALLPSTSTIYDAGQSPSLAPIGTPPSRSHGFYANAAYTSPPLGGLSGLSQTMAQQQQTMSMSPRSSVAAQVMLSEQSRRYSSSINGVVYNNNSDIRSSSPSRIQQLKPMRKSFGGEASFSTASPLAMPSSAHGNAVGNGGGGFATSPFSGSKALYMPSSYESSESFLGSPTMTRRGYEDVRNIAASSPWPIDDAIDLEGDDEYEERFLPSSLNDLLTPEEQFRRSTRLLAGGAINGSTNSNNFNPFSNSSSMPAPGFQLPSRISSTPGLSSQQQYQQSPPLAPRSLLSVSQSFQVQAQNPTPVPSAFPTESSSQRLSSSKAQLSTMPNALTTGFHSASFDPASAFLSSRSLLPRPLPSHSPLPSSQYQPTLYPSSLPKGLAAGLSSLHLLPAEHTGATPPLMHPTLPVLSNQSHVTSSTIAGSPLSLMTFISHEQLSTSAGLGAREANLPWNRTAVEVSNSSSIEMMKNPRGLTMGGYASGNSGGAREEEGFMFEMEE